MQLILRGGTGIADISVPPFGEAITYAAVNKWLKQTGEVIQAGEPIVELDTNLAIFQLEAGQDGVLQEILKAANEEVQVGERLSIISTSPVEVEEVSSNVVERTPITRLPSLRLFRLALRL